MCESYLVRWKLSTFATALPTFFRNTFLDQTRKAEWLKTFGTFHSGSTKFDPWDALSFWTVLQKKGMCVGHWIWRRFSLDSNTVLSYERNETQALHNRYPEQVGVKILQNVTTLVLQEKLRPKSRGIYTVPLIYVLDQILLDITNYKSIRSGIYSTPWCWKEGGSNIFPSFSTKLAHAISPPHKSRFWLFRRILGSKTPFRFPFRFASGVGKIHVPLWTWFFTSPSSEPFLLTYPVFLRNREYSSKCYGASSNYL